MVLRAYTTLVRPGQFIPYLNNSLLLVGHPSVPAVLPFGHSFSFSKSSIHPERCFDNATIRLTTSVHGFLLLQELAHYSLPPRLLDDQTSQGFPVMVVYVGPCCWPYKCTIRSRLARDSSKPVTAK